MAIDREGGAKADRTPPGRGSPSPLQVQHRESCVRGAAYDSLALEV